MKEAEEIGLYYSIKEGLESGHCFYFFFEFMIKK